MFRPTSYINSVIVRFVRANNGSIAAIFSLALIPILLGVGVWALVDAIMMFTGSVRDNNGRKLR